MNRKVDFLIILQKNTDSSSVFLKVRSSKGSLMADENYWIEQYKKKDALWIHDGNPRRPHALLTSGKHSSGFFNSRLIIPDEQLLREAVRDLLALLAKHKGDVWEVLGVVGPQTGATKLSEFLSNEITARVKNDCFSASPKKNEEKGIKSMVFSDKDKYLVYYQTVLLCDDVLTTGGSVDMAATAVTEAGGFVLPFFLVLVNRSGLAEVNGKKIVALIDRPMPTWAPEECTLCKEGSEAIRPKSPPEWARLNASY
jgi:orotate phosphoribosyltransferase